MEDTTLPVEELTTTTMPPKKKRGLLMEDILAIVGAGFFVLSIAMGFMSQSIQKFSEPAFWIAVLLWVWSFSVSVAKVGTKDEKKLKILPEEIAAIIGLILVILSALIGKFGKSSSTKVAVVMSMMLAGVVSFVASIIFAVKREVEKEE